MAFSLAHSTEGNAAQVALYPFGLKSSILKDLVPEHETPQKIKAIQFGMFSSSDMMRMSQFQLVNRELYQLPKREPMPNGPLDAKLGVSGKSGTCETCGQGIAECTGHFGHVRLALPVFHIGFMKDIVLLLQILCKSCSRVKLPEVERRYYLKLVRQTTEMLQRKVVVKEITSRAKKVNLCPYCNAINGTVKKVGVMRITHYKYREKKFDTMKREFLNEFEEAAKMNEALAPHLSRANDDLNPLRALHIFSRVLDEDLELIDIHPDISRPEDMILQYLLVPPVCIRPSVAMDASQGSNEDDLTMGVSKIIGINNSIEADMAKGGNIVQLMEKWDMLQIHVAMYINSEMPGVPPSLASSKPGRGLCQRLKGKKGRFRGNLSGKRVDFSSRTVISPDPNLSIDQVAVPVLVAQILTFPEKVFAHNIDRLRQYVINGPDKHPGANFIIDRDDGSKRLLKFVPDRKQAANALKLGDTVERHLIDGDVVLFNRQPSLHRISIMAHRARVMPWRTFRFNECVCGPYNADFDGDEMNLHLPQTEEARAEAMQLMAVNYNLITPRNGEPLVAATQDFLTASFLISRKDTFFDKSEFCMLCSFLCDANEHIDLPPPCIIKPIELWSGKQIFSVLLRPNAKSNVVITMEVKGRTYSGKPPNEPLWMCPKDGYVCIYNSEVLCGALDKKTLGGGSKENIFHVLMRDYSTKIAADRMTRLAKLCARWLGNRGFSIGISDVQPSNDLAQKKSELVRKGYERCETLINDYKRGELQLQPGCTAEETLEAKLNKELSDVREEAGSLCISELHSLNSPLIMALCGSKGSNINISQMVACVGQQTVSGARIPEGFIQRTLPHFGVNERSPEAKGFVKNSFFSGMTATEFFFHTMGGREGLVDTAVKTAETGYMQRRLMKALEDLSVQYDDTVRNSMGDIVQFVYGDDGLDPTGMEAKEKPVDFQRIMMQIQALYATKEQDEVLMPWQVKEKVEELLRSQQFRGGVDEHGVREKMCSDLFVQDVRNFFKQFIDSMVTTRKYLNLDAYDTKPKTSLAKHKEKQDDVVLRSRELAAKKINSITMQQLTEFFKLIRHKFKRAEIEPGTAVGALGAQSIGEPGTQMTLKTFHFAGVASMNITLGVPRIKEIINAVGNISTPIISATLVNPKIERAARIVKGRIEKTTLGQIAKYIKEVYTAATCYISIKLDVEAIHALQLEVNAHSVRSAILGTKNIKVKEGDVQELSGDKLRVFPPDKSREQMYFSLQSVKNALPGVLVRGIPTVSRAVINKKKQDGDTIFHLLVEGYDLLGVMGTPGVVSSETTSNHIMEVEETLGIEAARVTIMDQIQYTMKEHGMSIDTRHVMLLADLMCFRGEILGITRNGIAKMKGSVLMLASFEKTTDHLFDAAVHCREDEITGVSECIIMGIPMPLGTGLFKLLRQPDASSQPEQQQKQLTNGPLSEASSSKSNNTAPQQQWQQMVRPPPLLERPEFHLDIARPLARSTAAAAAADAIVGALSGLNHHHHREY
ncbi:DNA-directed RNA polymerase subunit [Balamuthia mandrillaris]